MKWTRAIGRLIVAFAVLGSIAVLPAEAVAQVPSRPGLTGCRTVALTHVELTWTHSLDDVGVEGYEIYRYWEPMTDDTRHLASLLGTVPGSATSTQVVIDTDERVLRKYTLYYAIRARDADNNYSTMSVNMTPDSHGTNMFGASTGNCQMCHTKAHGGIDAKGVGACYLCHGDTEGTSSYGYGSTKDAEYEFYEDVSDPGSSTATRHRNDYMTDTQSECDSCHTPHRRPADVNEGGTKNDATSFSKLLKRATDPSNSATGYAALTYSTDAVPFDNDLCYSCHGAQSAYMASRGGGDAYSDAGGDHETGFDASIHGSGTVLYTGRASDDPGPLISCYACHNEHATQTRALTDWRKSGVRDSTYDQSGLCFACHKTGSTESSIVAGYSAPFAWNDRDVQAEFQRTSHHPYQAAVSTQSAQAGSWAQTTEGQFGTDTLSSVETTDVGGGAVVLEAIGGGFEPNGTVLSTLISVGGTHDGWDELTINVDVPADTTMTVDVLDGSDDSTMTGYVDLVMSDGENVIGLALPGGIDHSLVPTLKLRAEFYGDTYGESPVPRTVSDDFNDSVFDTTTPVPRWYDVPTLGGATDPDASGTNTLFTDTFDSSLSPWTATNRDGAVWDIGNDDGSSVTPTDTDTELRWIGDSDTTSETCEVGRSIAIPSSAASASLQFDRGWYGFETEETLWIRWSSDGGSTWDGSDSWALDADVDWTTSSYTIPTDTDYIEFQAIANYNNEEVFIDDVTVTYDMPPDFWPDESGGELTLRGEGVDFAGTTDEGYYIYMSSDDTTWYAGTEGWEAVVQVTTETVTDADGRSGLMMRTGSAFGTGSGEVLEADAQTAGVYLTGDGNVEFVTREPNGGTASTQTVNSVTAPEWLKLAYDGSDSFTGWYSSDGSSWTQIGSAETVQLGTKVGIGLAQTSGDNGTFANATFDDFSVTESVSVVPSTETPRLDDWTVTYTYIPAVEGDGLLTCVNCHNTHMVQEGAASNWQTVRMSDPANTKNLWSETVTNFCLVCHDTNGAPASTRTSSVIVPYAAAFTDMSDYDFFTGWDKSPAFAGSKHYNAGCDTCHDPHGSDFQRLTAYSRDNTTTANSKEQNLCYQCHDSGAADLQAAFALTYTHPIDLTDRHADTETAGADGLGVNNRHSECVDCHNPHDVRGGASVATGSAGDSQLKGIIGVEPTYTASEWTSATAYTPITLDGETVYEAYLCLKCHSSYTTQPSSVTRNSRTYTPTDIALEFNPNNESGHNVMGNVWPKTSGLGAANDRTWSLPTDTDWLDAGWTRDSMITCSDCHTGDSVATGPHGSSVEYLIDSDYPTDWEVARGPSSEGGDPASTYPTVICNKCHDDSITGMNDVHNYQKHFRDAYHDGKCIACHVRIPHGWKRPRLIGYTTDPAPYTALGVTSMRDKNYTPTIWDDNDCGTTGCGTHSSNVTPKWP